MRVRYEYLFVLSVLAFGCGDETTAPTPPVSESHTWIGSFTEGGVRGALSLEIVTENSEFTGALVITRVPDLSAPEHLFVRGTIDDSLHLELDTDRIAYQYTFTLDAEVDSSLDLSGSISYPVAGVFTSFTAHPIPKRSVNVQLSYELSTYVRSMVWDGSRLWLSTLSDEFLRFNEAGEFQDQVIVYYSEGIRWTSGALTYDGTYLLGFLPTTIIGPGGTINASALYEFDENGIHRRYELPHRTVGLAYDGALYWSLDSQARQLVQFDALGAVKDSVEIDVPDPHHLEFDGQYFWTMSWYTMRLYQVDPFGHAVAMFDVPVSNPGQVPTAIAVQGAAIWYSEVVGLEHSRIYKLTPE
jgi:hypothetical protein